MTPSQRHNLRKFVSPEFIFGVGAIELSGKYASNFACRKALIVTDEGVKIMVGLKRLKNLSETQISPIVVSMN